MAHPKRILLLNVYFAPQTYGGATVVAESVARALVDRHGCQVTVVSTMERYDLVANTVMRTETDGIQNFAINIPGPKSYPERYDNPNVTERFAEILADVQPDLVHAHCVQNMGTGPLAMVKAQGLPLVLSVHDFWWLCEHQFMIRPTGQYCAQDPIRIENCASCVNDLGRAKRRFEHLKGIYSQADLITYPSRFARDLSVASGFPVDRSVVWENGVPLPAPDFFDKQAARRADDPRLVFGFVGGPSVIKGWPLIKSAFEATKQDNFAGLLVDATMDGSWWQGVDLSKMQGDWEIEPRFEQSQIDDFYAKIDVLLFPSQWKETFGLTIREAIARGIKVIQTDSGGTSEWQGADPASMLKIGEGPDALRTQIEAALDTPSTYPAPVPVSSYRDQADAFVKLIGGL